MGIWRDKASGKWKYAFQVNGKPYGGGGYQTKGEARMAREEKRKAILSGADSIAKETLTTRMGFAHLADLYLTQSQRRHADKTYRYKKYVYASFLKHAGDIPMKGFMKAFLLDLWEKRRQDESVFLNEKTGSRFNRRPKFMKGLCKRLGIPSYGFHAIRHFVSSYLLDKEKIGKPTVGRILGHQSLSTTDIYAHSINVNSVDDGLDMAMDKLEAAFVPKLLTPPATSSGSNEKTPEVNVKC